MAATITQGAKDSETMREWGNLETILAQEHGAVGGSPNPTWVEWLMGWPLGFTSLEPLGIMQWYLWFALFTGDNYEETDKGKHRASTGAKEVQGEGLCCVWFDNEAQPTPQGQEPVQQQEVECHDSLCNVPRKDSSGDGGQATCPASKVCRMWKRVSAKKDEEVDSLFSEMPFRAWKKERSQEMGWSKDDKNLCLLWQGICFQESQGDNMLSVMWEQARMGETWWSKEPIGLPRVATGVKDRVARLKAIGNGQVALCAATAWKLLTEILPRHQFPNV